MFQQNVITNLLGIANVFVDKIENNSSSIKPFCIYANAVTFAILVENDLEYLPLRYLESLNT